MSGNCLPSKSLEGGKFPGVHTLSQSVVIWRKHPKCLAVFFDVHSGKKSAVAVRFDAEIASNKDSITHQQIQKLKLAKAREHCVSTKIQREIRYLVGLGSIRPEYRYIWLIMLRLNGARRDN
jgi:hypothetical protein